MYATDFQFDGQLASSYGLIICSFDGGGGVESVRNGADVNLTTSRVPNSKVWNHVNAQYNEVLTVTFQVAKLMCDDNVQDPYFSVQEQRAINRWLNRLDNYYPFQIIQDGFGNIYFNAQINVNKIEFGGRVIGFELTVTTDKAYGYFEKQTLKFPLDKNGTYSFVDLSDDIGTVDIVMKITCAEAGDLTLTNSLTQQTMFVDDCSAGEVITIDTEKRKITSSIRTNAEMLKNFDFTWLNIGNTKDDKTNSITSTLPVGIELVYYPVCKISF